jgi:hypothetical protein
MFFITLIIYVRQKQDWYIGIVNYNGTLHLFQQGSETPHITNNSVHCLQSVFRQETKKYGTVASFFGRVIFTHTSNLRTK